MPILPENYSSLEETYYLQKNEIFQFLEKNLGYLTENKKKIWENHSSFYKAFVSLVQQSRNQSQRVPSESRVMNYKNLDKNNNDSQPLLNGIAKPNFFSQPLPQNMPKINGIENDKAIQNIKPPAFNNYIDYSKYSYRNDNGYNQMNIPKPPNQNFSNQIMTRSFQQPQYNNFFAMRNNYKSNPSTFQDPSLANVNVANLNVYGNQMKLTHTINPNLYNIQNNYAKYQTNMYMSNPQMRIQTNENMPYIDENLPKYHENFNYFGDQMQKKINIPYYPQTNNENLYYKNIGVSGERDNSHEYINGYPTSHERTNGMRNYEEINDFNMYDKKNENKYNGNNIEENYLIGDNDEFKIKRVNSLNKITGQKQIEDFLANNQESRVHFND